MVQPYRKRTMPEPPLQAQITLRPATQQDCRRVWEWRNEPETREASFDTSYIPYKDHERWFSRRLPAPDTRIYIVLDGGGREVGYVRFDISEEQADISVSLDKDERGKGYGTAAIRRGSGQLLAEGYAKRVLAYVKRGNAASKAAFQRAGFALAGMKDVAGTQAYEMVYKGAPQDAQVRERTPGLTC